MAGGDEAVGAVLGEGGEGRDAGRAVAPFGVLDAGLSEPAFVAAWAAGAALTLDEAVAEAVCLATPTPEPVVPVDVTEAT